MKKKFYYWLIKHLARRIEMNQGNIANIIKGEKVKWIK